ncbi:DnaJ domain-containing protein [Pseudanabaena yagii]|uniref:DnaJ domain-containing protein n=1 Tax=Pseudanabaena yagii GIHE-NHR1 TaxID=2722753 RepID=A0ABX1LM30_9CYAN|nr:DnaJ domain-containing protein [Pseudanabaena yagii]NMF57187.1 DnaJ domain-containing protein [Pseudanabaena yagii GIHE-NHR1]
MENPRTFRIERGIGQYDFNDYYAVLGLPLTAEASQVRRRYLLIAKCLHPDIHGRTPSEKQVATQYLSKLVNPAYDVLSQERERTEYSAILKLLGKRLMKRNQTFTPQSELAKKYLTAATDINYEQTIQTIAKVQYQDLDQVLEHIGLLSELNLVHILLQEGYRHKSHEAVNSGISTPKVAVTNGLASNINSNSTSNTSNTSGSRVSSTYPNSTNSTYQMRSEAQVSPRSGAGNANNTASNANNTASNSTGQNQAAASNNASGSSNQYIRQAEAFINQKLWASALKELRSAIQVDCNNSKCHALLGFVYMNQKLSGMAKVSFQQALKLNPEEPLALQYINQVSGITPNVEKNQAKPKDEKKGGFFGWLGGG